MIKLNVGDRVVVHHSDFFDEGIAPRGSIGTVYKLDPFNQRYFIYFPTENGERQSQYINFHDGDKYVQLETWEN